MLPKIQLLTAIFSLKFYLVGFDRAIRPTFWFAEFLDSESNSIDCWEQLGIKRLNKI